MFVMSTVNGASIRDIEIALGINEATASSPSAFSSPSAPL
jgi:hypothetical protein